MPPFEKLTALVKKHFPNSKWKKTHYSWYKSKIKSGEIAFAGLTDEDGSEMNEPASELDTVEGNDLGVSLERDLQLYYSTRVCELEQGLSLVTGGIEYQTAAGRIDLLTKDDVGRLAVIELKVGKAGDAALGQLLGYMGCLSVEMPNVRGILVASDFDARVMHAARGLPSVKLLKYRLSFHLQEVMEERTATARGA